jgi:endonuclease III
VKLHVKAAWNVLFKGMPTAKGLAKMNEAHWRRINELEKGEGAAKEAVKNMVRPECLKEHKGSDTDNAIEKLFSLKGEDYDAIRPLLQRLFGERNSNG